MQEGLMKSKYTYNIVSKRTKKLGRFKVVLDIIKEKSEKFPYSYVEVKPGVCVLASVNGKFIYKQSTDMLFAKIAGVFLVE